MNTNFANPNLPALANFGPILDVPNNAPPLRVDVNNPDLSFEDVLPAQYISMENLAQWLESRQAESRVLTVTAVSMELLYDPATEKPEQGEWKPVLWFLETESGLVINKSRGQLLTKYAGPLLANWAKIGKVAIKVGVCNGKAQVILAPIPTAPTPKPAAPNRSAGKPVTEINDDLFPS